MSIENEALKVFNEKVEDLRKEYLKAVEVDDAQYLKSVMVWVTELVSSVVTRDYERRMMSLAHISALSQAWVEVWINGGRPDEDNEI